MPDKDPIREITTLMETSGVTIEDVLAALAESTSAPPVAAKAESTSARSFAAVAAALLENLDENSRRTYRTHLLRLREGVPEVCTCSCETCCAVESRDLSYGTVTQRPAKTVFPAGTHCDNKTCRKDRLGIGGFADRPMQDGEFTRTELERYVKIAHRMAVQTAHRNNRTRVKAGLKPERTDATSALGGAVLTIRRVFAEVPLHTNPAAGLKAPQRKETRKRSMTDTELIKFLDVVTTAGDDADLDYLLVWFHLETGARQQGGVGLTLDRIDPTGRIEVFEKNSVYRDQPATVELCNALLSHARERGGDACDPNHPNFNPQAPVFYYRPAKDGTPRPLTAKRYETLFRRVQRSLPFANEIHLTSHQLRKTGAVQVERLAGTQVARKWLGHGSRTDTDGYAQASYAEIVEVHKVRFSELERSDEADGQDM